MTTNWYELGSHAALNANGMSIEEVIRHCSEKEICEMVEVRPGVNTLQIVGTQKVADFDEVEFMRGWNDERYDPSKVSWWKNDIDGLCGE